jgi:hypothetical protein
VLGTFRRAVSDEDGRRRRDDEGDADDCLLRELFETNSCQGEESRRQGGKREAEQGRTELSRVLSECKTDHSSEGGKLCDGEVDEEDPTFDDVDTEVRVEAHQNQAGCEGCGHEAQHVDHLRSPDSVRATSAVSC